jgi:tetratricopeptide (TPR) repeat protein
MAIAQKLVDDNPDLTLFRVLLARSHDNLGWRLLNAGKPAEAEAECRKALALQQQLADGQPGIPRNREYLALMHRSLGSLLLNTGKSAEAEAEYRKALTIHQKLADDNPPLWPRYQRGIAVCLGAIGWRFAQAGKMDEALRYYMREEGIWQKLAEASSPTPDDGKNGLANCQTNKAEVLRRSGRLDEALAACQRALSLRELLAEAHPEALGYRVGLGATHLRLGQVRCDLKDVAGAASAWKRACAHLDALKSSSAEQTFCRACCHAALAGLAGRPGSGLSAAEGEEHAERSIGLLRQAVSMGYRNRDDYRIESALDLLRNRHDFRALMMDLAFPVEPFAPVR